MEKIWTSNDQKIEQYRWEGQEYLKICSAMGYPAIYPLHQSEYQAPLKAVLMDLDGTSVCSETFFIKMIELTIAHVMEEPSFRFAQEDIPHVSGYSVSEHLQYCIDKYAPQASVEQAREAYYVILQHEMNEILEGRGDQSAFQPMPHLKVFLQTLKEKGVRIALVTSGSYEKTIPEIVSAFQQIDMGDPRSFYDCIVTGGYPAKKGSVGTIGEMALKPHPWLYAEALRIGLGLDFEERHHVIGIEDSAAGAIALRLAGVSCIAIAGGNIEEAGMTPFCEYQATDLADALQYILGKD